MLAYFDTNFGLLHFSLEGCSLEQILLRLSSSVGSDGALWAHHSGAGWSSGEGACSGLFASSLGLRFGHQSFVILLRFVLSRVTNIVVCVLVLWNRVHHLSASIWARHSRLFSSVVTIKGSSHHIIGATNSVSHLIVCHSTLSCLSSSSWRQCLVNWRLKKGSDLLALVTWASTDGINIGHH